MIDAISIFTKGGVVLWSFYYIKLKTNPVEQLIKTILLEERAGQKMAFFDSQKIQWKLINRLDLVFVVVYSGIQSIAYIDSVLTTVTTEFLAFMGNPTSPSVFLNTSEIQFDAAFMKALERCEKQHQKALGKGGKGGKYSKIVSKSDSNTSPGFGMPRTDSGCRKGHMKTEKGGIGEDSKGGSADQKCVDSDEITARRKQLFSKKCSKRNGTVTISSTSDPNGVATTKENKAKKVATKWHSQKVTKKTMDQLDFSLRAETTSGGSSTAKNGHEDSGGNELFGSSDDGTDAGHPQSASLEDSDSLSAGSDDDAACNGEDDKGTRTDGWGSKAKGLFSGLSMSVKRLTGNAELTSEELDGVLASFREGLLAKNVAGDIAAQLVDSVKATLEGSKTERWTSVKATVKTELTQVVKRILTPKKSVDVLKAALEAKAKAALYSICFLGVNGVGKSTNLAKVAYFLKQKGGLNVMIAACDTFRAGAVEQLRTHADRLEIHLFEQGYGKDPAMIAQRALQYARSNRYDVVLIDTAGRMQDNEPLMRALSKLVAINQPDLLLFVGEALVGNDGVDQLRKFDQCLTDYAPTIARPSERRNIDGVLLTKFDTVDDKVGAALSMVYQTGQPIVFVGTGQKYTHLRKFEVDTVVKALLG